MSGNHKVTKDFSKSGRLTWQHNFQFADISKIFTNNINVIYLNINNENDIISAPLLNLFNIAKYR